MPPPAHLLPELLRHRVLGTKDAADLCGVSVPTLRRMRKKQAIPAPLRLSERKLGWRVGDLLDWLDSREADLPWHEFKASRAKNDNHPKGT
ncbi:helix-turn-helix domain-containing protein [Methylobacterium segetis]|uniref:helix-turn-helix transcriptional regulator n=1 Tax=Methylobacterium segetis TaxID=2488750 RepID=UPI0010436757